MEPTIWMVNITGASRSINISQVNFLETKGWRQLDRNYLTEKGQPKQMYWPQFDQSRMDFDKKTGQPQAIQTVPLKEVLEVETF